MGKYRFQSIMAPLMKMAEALFDLFVPLVMARLINTGIGNNDREYILKRLSDIDDLQKSIEDMEDILKRNLILIIPLD